MCANHTNHPKLLRGSSNGRTEDCYFYCMSVMLQTTIEKACIKEMPKYSEVSKWPFLRSR